MNQQEIEVMSEALRERGLTWSQTNFAIALARNAIAAAINAMPPDPELERLRVENEVLRKALRGLHDDIEGLIDESSGVYGLHLNGDLSPWDELAPGGRFERLAHLSIARAALQETNHEQ